MNGLKSYNRIKWIPGPVLVAAQIDAAKTFTLDMTGFSAALLYIKYTRSAATTVKVTATTQHPSSFASGTTPDEYKTPTEVFDVTGLCTVATFHADRAVSTSDKWQEVIPVSGGQTTFSIVGTAADTDVVTVYAALAG